MEKEDACNNTQPCPCSETACARHGKCCECVAQHRKSGNLPACLRGLSPAQGQ